LRPEAAPGGVASVGMSGDAPFHGHREITGEITAPTMARLPENFDTLRVWEAKDW
jgi:hypothetical protein